MTTLADARMVSRLTPHTARRVQLAPERWRASWCPEKLLDRGQAVTAMVAAEMVGMALAHGPLVVGDPLHGHVAGWAAELGLDGPAALSAIAKAPHVLDRRLHMMSTSCWCDPAAALDGHINEDGTGVEFAATDSDPVDADGFLLEELV